MSLVIPFWLCNPPQIFDYATFQCNSNFRVKCDWIVIYFALIILFGPFIFILVTSVWLLVYVARKRSSGLQKQGVVTIILVSVNFFISNIPFSVFFTVMAAGTDIRKVAYFPQIYRFVVYILNLNFVSNPIIYYLSIASFKRFVDAKILCRGNGMIVTPDPSRRLTQGTRPESDFNLRI